MGCNCCSKAAFSVRGTLLFFCKVWHSTLSLTLYVWETKTSSTGMEEPPSSEDSEDNQMDWQMIWQANELRTSKVTPSLLKTKQAFAWTTRKMLGYWTCHLHHCASSTSQSVLWIQEKKKKRLILAPPILYGALSPLLLHCMSLEPREASVAQRLDSTDGCIQQWGKQNQQTPAHFDTNILIHASTCIQIHNQTRCHSNILLCICTVYPLCIVSDAVICMLICRWSVTIIH